MDEETRRRLREAFRTLISTIEEGYRRQEEMIDKFADEIPIQDGEESEFFEIYREEIEGSNLPEELKYVAGLLIQMIMRKLGIEPPYIT